jgi:hypothetical protein
MIFNDKRGNHRNDLLPPIQGSVRRWRNGWNPGSDMTIDLLELVASFKEIAGPVLPAQLREKAG